MTNISQSTVYRLKRSRCDLHHTYLCTQQLATLAWSCQRPEAVRSSLRVERRCRRTERPSTCGSSRVRVPPSCSATAFPDTAETWRSQMRAVAQAGFRAVALDMRGYGAIVPCAEFYTALHTVGDLVACSTRFETAARRSRLGADVVQKSHGDASDRFRVGRQLEHSPLCLVARSAPERPSPAGTGDRYYAFSMMEPGAASSLPHGQYLYIRPGFRAALPGNGWGPHQSGSTYASTVPSRRRAGQIRAYVQSPTSARV